MSGYDGIDKVLGVVGDVPVAVPTEETSCGRSEIVIKTAQKPLTDEELEKDLRQDYNSVRKNLIELVDYGKNALDGILQVAQEGDSPRAYEVAAQIIKTLSETNRELLDMHNRVKTIRKVDQNLTQNNTTNQSIYVGSTKELQDIINSARSSVKAFDNRPDVRDIIDQDKKNE